MGQNVIDFHLHLQQIRLFAANEYLENSCLIVKHEKSIGAQFDAFQNALKMQSDRGRLFLELSLVNYPVLNSLPMHFWENLQETFF